MTVFKEHEAECADCFQRQWRGMDAAAGRLGCRDRLHLWVVTALDFISNKATLRPCDGDNGPINYDGEKREIPLMELPWES